MSFFETKNNILYLFIGASSISVSFYLTILQILGYISLPILPYWVPLLIFYLSSLGVLNSIASISKSLTYRNRLSVFNIFSWLVFSYLSVAFGQPLYMLVIYVTIATISSFLHIRLKCCRVG